MGVGGRPAAAPGRALTVLLGRCPLTRHKLEHLRSIFTSLPLEASKLLSLNYWISLEHMIFFLGIE